MKIKKELTYNYICDEIKLEIERLYTYYKTKFPNKFISFPKF